MPSFRVRISVNENDKARPHRTESTDRGDCRSSRSVRQKRRNYQRIQSRWKCRSQMEAPSAVARPSTARRGGPTRVSGVAGETIQAMRSDEPDDSIRKHLVERHRVEQLPEHALRSPALKQETRGALGGASARQDRSVRALAVLSTENVARQFAPIVATEIVSSRFWITSW